MSRLLWRITQNGHCHKLLKLALPGAQKLFYHGVFRRMLIVTTTMNWTSTAQLTCPKPIVLWMVSHILGQFSHPTVLFWNNVVSIRIVSYFPIIESGIKLPYRHEVSKSLLKYQKTIPNSRIEESLHIDWLSVQSVGFGWVGAIPRPNPTDWTESQSYRLFRSLLLPKNRHSL